MTSNDLVPEEVQKFKLGLVASGLITCVFMMIATIIMKWAEESKPAREADLDKIHLLGSINAVLLGVIVILGYLTYRVWEDLGAMQTREDDPNSAPYAGSHEE